MKKITECPKCGKPIWGEGWNPMTGDRYFSHCPPYDGTCDDNIVISRNPATEETK